MVDSAKLKDFAPGEGVAAGAFAERFDTSGWNDVSVPGDVHRALMAAGRIEDPFYDSNEVKCAWMEDREWWYRLSFDGPPEPPEPDERLLLIFHGLDTFATIWLNGEELGRHRNMFREAVFGVGGRGRATPRTRAALSASSGCTPHRSTRRSGAPSPKNSSTITARRWTTTTRTIPRTSDLRSAGYAYFVHLSVPDEAAYLSDNYFDLEARRAPYGRGYRRAGQPDAGDGDGGLAIE